MTDPMRVFVDAQRSCEQATARCEAHRRWFEDMARNFHDWRDVRFSQLDVGAPGVGGTDIDASGWPEAEVVARDVSEWHKAVYALDLAWHSMRESDRASLQKPAEIP